MIKTLLFDLDGTLINTNELIIASFTHTLEHYYPGRFTRQDIIAFIGEPLEESFSRIDEERTDDMVAMYREHNHRMHDSLVTEFPHVYETLGILAEQGFKLGIVTTKRRKTVLMGLKLAKLEEFFDVVVTIDDVDNAKPHPEPVLRAMKALNADVTSTVMIGDSPYDIQSGKNANVLTVGVAWSIKGRAVIESEKPDFVIDDMAELLDIAGAAVK
ncbi:pyrophosphatase PpaX [Scopulibacillus darangshiensis]|uniref:Pyrophosphatase PpaX n=1 Tax=Scopulibacillus darangshiensis TaxID=442528 RepID=A0A4R2NU27_9BACL|nr:pyrophosphatase PpaX [Scopulibacillus darangshiensis]TCP24885.1 pyrophosphatase PpaX [Scopulibacillus darangshiensis]